LRTLADIEAAHQKGGQPLAKAGYTLIARTTAHAPWTLLYVVSDSEVGALLLPHFLPYAILLLALAATLPIALFVLQRELISPALQLVRYIQRVSRDPAAQEPELPRLWTTWVKVVSRTFAANRAAHQKLKESEAFKAAIVDNAILAVVTIDTSGCIVEFNPAAEAIFGHRLAEARGKDMADLIIPQRLRDAHRRGMESYRRSGELQLLGRRLELPALRADGTEFPIALSISVTEVGGKRYLTAFISDLTEQKRANEELARQREALRQNEKLSAMGSMLAGVAHELNNPLAILMGRAALLEAKLSDPTARADIEKIRVAAERCGRIVKTFLGMARQRPADRRLAQLNDIAAGALDLLGYSWRSAGIKVQTDLASDLPQVWIDPDQVGQVVVNLLVNAQQALAEQPEPRLIRIESGRVAEGPNAGVYLRVTDNGPGGPAVLHARIFEPFFTTKQEHGYRCGLGGAAASCAKTAANCICRALARRQPGLAAAPPAAAAPLPCRPAKRRCCRPTPWSADRR
jgi:PAS domain S-box-containing protein